MCILPVTRAGREWMGGLSMERLTEREDGNAYFPQCFEEPCLGAGCVQSQCDFTEKVCERLAAYEDTGLTPGMAIVALAAITGLARGDRELALNSLQKLAEELEATS